MPAISCMPFIPWPTACTVWQPWSALKLFRFLKAAAVTVTVMHGGEPAKGDQACLDIWIQDTVEAGKDVVAAAGAGAGVLSNLSLLAVQELLVPLVDLLLPAHEVVLPQNDVALVVLDQQPAHIGYHEDEEAKGDPAAGAPAASGQEPSRHAS